MITTNMKGSDIIKEYLKDSKVIREKSLQIISQKRDKIQRAYIKTKKPITLSTPLKVTTENGNTYYNILTIPKAKKGKVWDINSTIYTILVDSTIGKKVV